MARCPGGICMTQLLDNISFGQIQDLDDLLCDVDRDLL